MMNRKPRKKYMYIFDQEVRAGLASWHADTLAGGKKFLKGKRPWRVTKYVRVNPDPAGWGRGASGMSEVFTYRGICEHGKVRVMIVDDPQWARNTASEVAKCICRGLAIDRVTVEEARKSDMKCPACDEKNGKNKRKRPDPAPSRSEA